MKVLLLLPQYCLVIELYSPPLDQTRFLALIAHWLVPPSAPPFVLFCPFPLWSGLFFPFVADFLYFEFLGFPNFGDLFGYFSS